MAATGFVSVAGCGAEKAPEYPPESIPTIPPGRGGDGAAVPTAPK